MAATAVLLGSTLAAPAHAVPGDGKGEIVVKLVDPAGKPTAGVLLVFAQGMTTPATDLPDFNTMTTQVAGSLTAGRYGALAMSPWGGIACLGIDPCSYLALIGAPSPSPVVGAFDVADVETPVVATIKNTAPGRITGGHTVGDQLTFAWSTGMKDLIAIIPSGAGQYAPTVTWLRDGKPVGAGPTYDLTPADVGRRISARLAYGEPNIWTAGFHGLKVAPYDLPSFVATKRPTRTTADLFRKSLVQGRGTGLIVDVTSAQDAVTDGKVKVTVGKWKATKEIRNGSARFALPKTLKAGRYQVQVTYLGSSTYLGSKAKKQTLTVKPPHRR